MIEKVVLDVNDLLKLYCLYRGVFMEFGNEES